MKLSHFLIAFICLINLSYTQVGINTSTPDPSSIFDVVSSDKGILIPRLTTVQRDAIVNPANSLFIFNTDTNSFNYNSGTSIAPTWTPINGSNPSVSSDANNQITSGTDSGAFLGRGIHMDKFIINASGAITISGLPFEPSQIKFTAYANVDTYNLDADNGVGNNNGSIPNVFGSTSGFATNYSGTRNEQTTFIGGSGNSINDISRYASSSHCIGVRYANQNGNNIGITSATVTSFNPDGFTLNVDSYADSIIVIFEAYR